MSDEEESIEEFIAHCGYDPRTVYPTRQTPEAIVVLMWNIDKQGFNTHVFGGGWDGEHRETRIRE